MRFLSQIAALSSPADSLSPVGQCIHLLGTRFRNALPDVQIGTTGGPPPVGILANLDSLTYATTVLALIRAGFQVHVSYDRIPVLFHSTLAR